MARLELFKAVPRPLGQYFTILLIWPVWMACGVAEAIWSGSGSVVQDQIESGIESLPPSGWAAITAILLAQQWSRTKGEEMKMKEAEAKAQTAEAMKTNNE